MILLPLSASHEWQWVKERTHVIACEDSQGIVAYDDEYNILAVVVADSFTVDACCVHIAVDNPFVMRHGFLEEVARHLFVTCGRKRLFGMVPENNKKALKLDAHLGFTEVARVPDAVAEGVAYVIMRLEKQDCRYLPQEFREAA